MSKFDRVIDDMSHVIRPDPGEPTAYYYRGMGYGELDDLDLAIADLNETILMSPDHADAYRVRGD